MANILAEAEVIAVGMATDRNEIDDFIQNL